MKYAQGTYVTKEQTIGEIRDLIEKNGGQVHHVISQENHGEIIFLTPVLGVPVKYTLIYETQRDPNKTQQAINEKWRAAYLTLKAKFVAISEGFETAEEVFMAKILQQNNAVASVTYLPQILRNSNRDLVKVSRVAGAPPTTGKQWVEL